jgi:hypothetical protein
MCTAPFIGVAAHSADPADRFELGRDASAGAAGHGDVRQQAGGRPPGERRELGLYDRADLCLRLRVGQVEGQRRDLVGGALETAELVPDL